MKAPSWLPVAGLIGGHLLFWGWNLLFLSVLLFGLGPEVLIDVFQAVRIGLIPPVFAVVSVLIIAMPVATMAVGLWRFRRDPGRLLTLFYGIQAPIMFVAFMRLFAFEQLNTSSTLVLVSFSLGALALIWTVIAGPEVKWGPGQLLLLIAQSAYGLCGLWVAASLGLFTLPMAAQLAAALLEIRLLDLFIIAFLLMTAAVFVLFPVAMVGLSLRAWSLVYGRTRQRLGQPTALACSIGTVAVLLAAMGMATAVQPQERAFEILESGDKAAANAQAEDIRRGLLEAYLWRSRYLSNADLYDNIHDLWDDSFFEGAGVVPAWISRGLYAPFVYRQQSEDGYRRWSTRDEEMAGEAYAAFFDAPITRAERETILDARQSTWFWQDAAASVLDVGQQRVWLAAQEVSIEEHGDHATITVHDVYQNRTWDEREVVIYFSLPETAALTGLWLGHTDDRSEAFTHVVAPRGAAQQVYREQVRRNRDPALLEQVGPQQYRLRAFPIQPRTGSVSDISTVTETGPSFHLWMELQVLATPAEDGTLQWPLPQVAEIRNLYWDTDSKRTVSGAPMAEDAWLPESLPRTSTSPLTPRQVSLRGWSVDLSPAAPAAPSIPEAPAVVIDTSRSMADRRDAITAATARLSAERVFCAVPGGVERCDWSEETMLYGRISLVETLQALAQHPDLQGATDVIVLTDQETYDQAVDGEAMDLPPLWLVHFSGLPLAYSDAVLDSLVKNGGGVGTSLDAVLRKRGQDSTRSGWRIQATAAEEQEATPAEASLHAIAAHAAIEVQAGWSDPAALADLDALHALAVEYDVVSPYSSMIVLVNDVQRQRLEELSEDSDRFEREAESAAAEEEGMFDLGAVPEPEEWVLLFIAGFALLGIWRRQ